MAPMAICRVHGATGSPGKNAYLGDLIENPAAHAFGAMALKSMRDFMGHDRGQPIFVFRVFQDTRKNRNLSSGKGKGINHAIVLNNRKFPMIFRFIGCGCYATANAVDHFIDVGIDAEPGLSQNVTKGTDPQCNFLFLRKKDDLVARGPRSFDTAGQKQEPAEDCTILPNVVMGTLMLLRMVLSMFVFGMKITYLTQVASPVPLLCKEG